MRRFSRFSGPLVSTAVVISPWLIANTSSAQAVNHETDDSRVDTADGNTLTANNAELCQPMFGAGKSTTSTGVPIAVERSDGQLLTDVTGLTFELDNGAGATQDVTSEIKTAAEQPLVVNQDEGGNLTDTLNIHIDYETPNRVMPASAVGINYDNPGYYFLNCLPNVDDITVKFSTGITLKAKRDGVVVASASVAGRGGAKLIMSADTGEPNNGFFPISNAAIHSVIRPVSGDHTSLSTLYQGYLDRVGIPFNETFASIAVVELSNYPYNYFAHCFDDLVTVQSGTWVWNNTGQAFVNELTNGQSVARPMLQNRTRGKDNQGNNLGLGLFETCEIDSNEDDHFMNYLAAQLLLIDAPAGRVPESLLNANVSALNGETETYLKPAVRLISTIPSSPTTTTTSTTIAPTTTVSKVQKLTRLPSTGNEAVPSGLMALGAIVLGSVVVIATRRRVMSQK